MSISATEQAQLLSLAAGGAVLPVGAANTTPFAQTFDRRFATSTVFAPTSGTLTMTGIYLPQGAVVNGITFVSGSTAESGGQHLWYALYNSSLAFLAQATDNTGAAAIAANTAFRMALTAPYTITASGLYYLGFLCVQSAGGVPTLLNCTAATANANGSITGMTPILAATSTTGIAGGAAPSPAGALTAITQALYAFVD